MGKALAKNKMMLIWTLLIAAVVISTKYLEPMASVGMAIAVIGIVLWHYLFGPMAQQVLNAAGKGLKGAALSGNSSSTTAKTNSNNMNTTKKAAAIAKAMTNATAKAKINANTNANTNANATANATANAPSKSSQIAFNNIPATKMAKVVAKAIRKNK